VQLPKKSRPGRTSLMDARPQAMGVKMIGR